MVSDLKSSEFVKNLEQYLKSQNLKDVPYEEFGSHLARSVNEFLKLNQCPLSCNIGRKQHIVLCMDEDTVVTKIQAYYEVSHKMPVKGRTISFKSLAKKGPCYDRTLSEIIGRRVLGILYTLDFLAYQAGELGYSSFEEMCNAYTEAKETVNNLELLMKAYDAIPSYKKQKYIP